ncbi:unnamed protein product [Miscanthus lutarioriparius]|uniref:Uncharacterized protein n=1 Tax=Miscanthus lutarioriparius TaxID=422564 RepID=A0A811NY45_9POAL|nr:unnamed protein product [Miscanthus lutarioriparius]
MAGRLLAQPVPALAWTGHQRPRRLEADEGHLQPPCPPTIDLNTGVNNFMDDALDVFDEMGISATCDQEMGWHVLMVVFLILSEALFCNSPTIRLFSDLNLGDLIEVQKPAKAIAYMRD